MSKYVNSRKYERILGGKRIPFKEAKNYTTMGENFSYARNLSPVKLS